MSSGLFFLTDREFSLQASQNGLPPGAMNGEGPTPRQYDLVHRIPGVTVVFFYSISCPVCKPLFHEFKGLPGKVHGVNFAVANVSANNMRIQQMAEASITPIRYVPYIVVYVNGKFYLEYRGPKKIENIARASYEIASKIQSGKDFTQGKVCTSQNGAQGYCVDGYSQDDDDNMCYTYEEIYGGGKVCNSKSGKCYTYDEIYGS